MIDSRRIAGYLMLASAVTHTSELFVFGFGPVAVIVLAFAIGFLFIGIGLLRDGHKVLWWGAVVPSIAIVLGIGNSIRNDHLHMYTIWHLAVDFTVAPICAYHLVKSRSRPPAA